MTHCMIPLDKVLEQAKLVNGHISHDHGFLCGRNDWKVT